MYSSTVADIEPYLSITSSQPCWFNSPPGGSPSCDEAGYNTPLVFVAVQPDHKLVPALQDKTSLIHLSTLAAKYQSLPRDKSKTNVIAHGFCTYIFIAEYSTSRNTWSET